MPCLRGYSPAANPLPTVSSPEFAGLLEGSGVPQDRPCGASPLLYDVLRALIEYCYPIMHKVNQNIRHIEHHLFHAETEHILHDIAIVRRDVIALRHILRPQCDIINTLEQGNWPFMAT